MLDFLSQCSDYKFQLIITTHSPYLLSDLPGNNIVLLKREDGKRTSLVDAELFKTFGANINELLATSFFLEEGLIGEFAQANIQNLIDNLQGFDGNKGFIEMSKEEMRRMIGFVAEPFLQEKLQEMYDEKFPGEFVSEGQRRKLISQLENQLKRLRNG